MERFILQKSRKNGCWTCVDTQFNIAISWQEHKFNDTQCVKTQKTEKINLNEVKEIARAMREIGQWLYDNHQDIVF